MAQIDIAKVKVAGSAEEVRAIKLDPKRVYTCGSERFGVRGCPMYDRCERPEKDLEGFVVWQKDGSPIVPMKGREANPELEHATREGPGPMEVGITAWKTVGGISKVINMTRRCWEYPTFKRNWEAGNQGGEPPQFGCKIVAIEGERFAEPGSKPEVQPDGKIIHVIQPEGVERIIPPFVRPRDNRAFAASAFATAELEREEQRMKATNLKDFVHLRGADHGEPGATPDGATGTGARRGAASRG